MPTLENILFHGYVFGTAFWYALRGSCRVYDPVMVSGWFRPPAQLSQKPTDLELYNIKTDGWCLIALALFLVSLTGSVAGNLKPADVGSYRIKKYYAKAGVAITVLHHALTGVGAWGHYQRPTHYNTSMAIGVWGNVWLVAVGLATLAALQLQPVGGAQAGRQKKAK